MISVDNPARWARKNALPAVEAKTSWPRGRVWPAPPLFDGPVAQQDGSHVSKATELVGEYATPNQELL
jgi:hypothetical protein